VFKNPTVLILGAGASCECGMPLGGALRDRIADGLNFRFDDDSRMKSGDGSLYELLKNHYKSNYNDALWSGRRIAGAAKDFPSIDELLHFLRKETVAVDIGKLAIVYYILGYENNFRTPQTGQPDFGGLSESWYAQFFSMAISGVNKEDIVKIFDNVTFINFNYDRTLECYLYYALMRASITADVAGHIVSRMKTIRPYGALGTTDWQSEVSVGGAQDQTIFDRVALIRTFTEAYTTELKDRIEVALHNSKLVLCLGFGFHHQNMQLLSSTLEDRRKDNGRKVFATMKDIHLENQETLRTELGLALQCAPGRITILDMTAGEMLTKLRPMIMAASR